MSEQHQQMQQSFPAITYDMGPPLNWLAPQQFYDHMQPLFNRPVNPNQGSQDVARAKVFQVKVIIEMQ